MSQVAEIVAQTHNLSWPAAVLGVGCAFAAAWVAVVLIRAVFRI